MSDERALDALLRSAIAAGIVPADASAPAHDERPWPVVLLTAFGAWLAALPLIGLAALLLADVLKHGAGAYIAGALVLAGAIAALRRQGVPLFVEQLVIPALIVGAALLGFGLFRDLPPAAACVVLALVAVACAVAIRRPWLRVVLGAAAATLLALAWAPWRGGWSRAFVVFWLAWHVDLLLWAGAGIAGRTLLADGGRARAAAALESLAAGWLLATLVGLAWWSGMTFLVGGTLSSAPLADVFGRPDAPAASAPTMTLLRAASVLLASAGAAWAARRWPTLRNPAGGGVGLVLIAVAAFMPALGAALLALSACATAKRWRLAAAAAVTAAWIVGGFYYRLAWPLTTKAGVLVIAGVVLGALAALAFPARRGAVVAATTAPIALRWGAGGARTLPIDRAGIVATAALVGLAANVAIWQKERLIADGEPVFVALAPVDPRSLMQGDFMRLDFRIPPQLLEDAGGLLDKKRPRIVARRDERGVLTFVRAHRDEPLAERELQLELTPLHGDWGLVSDAWSFPEGQASRWAAARFGEFRVVASGQALLVGLRGANLERL